MTTSEKKRMSVDDMFDALEDPELESALHGQEITAESFNSLSSSGSAGLPSRRTLRARFFGRATDQHSMDVKPAAKALIAIQDVVSTIGATLSAHQGQVGKLPGNIIQSTRLVLAPTVAPGSVIFTLQTPPVSEDELPCPEVENSLMDEAVIRFIEILGTASSSENADALAEMLQQTGPRTASHLFNLTDALMSEDVGLGLEWLNGQGGLRSTEIPPSAVQFLRGLAKKSSVQTKDVTLKGTLSTVSRDHQQELTLADGSRVRFKADDDQLRQLAPHTLSPIAIRVSERTSVAHATGNVTRTYTMIGLGETETGGTASGDK